MHFLNQLLIILLLYYFFLKKYCNEYFDNKRKLFKAWMKKPKYRK